MNVLEKILEEMKKIKDGNRKEKLYAKYPAKNKRQEILNIYSQGYEDGTDNFYNAMDSFIRSRMDDANDTNVSSNWIAAEERLPEETGYYLVQLSRKLPNEDYADRVVVLYNAEEKEFMCYEKLIKAWQPLPEPYK